MAARVQREQQFVQDPVGVRFEFHRGPGREGHVDERRGEVGEVLGHFLVHGTDELRPRGRHRVPRGLRG
ncbi:hypothetical protein ACWF95_03535 [Streptomyces vinaceus]|uniref:hypothetical protein n=1 Tax=Streptomyces vinaceus TaxID=1960 RepID=UPI0035DD9F22